MDAEAALGLTRKWWLLDQEHEKIAPALLKGVMRHSWQIVKEALARNRQTHQEPSSVLTLAGMLDWNERNLGRTGAGTYPLGLVDAYEICCLLEIPADRFFPSTRQWLGNVAHEICGEKVSATEADAYAAYILDNPPQTNPELDSRSVQSVLQTTNGAFHSKTELETAILRVAGHIGRFLRAEIPDLN